MPIDYATLSKRTRQLSDVFEDIENIARPAKIFAEENNLVGAFIYLEKLEKLVLEAAEKLYYEIRKNGKRSD